MLKNGILQARKIASCVRGLSDLHTFEAYTNFTKYKQKNDIFFMDSKEFGYARKSRNDHAVIKTYTHMRIYLGLLPGGIL